MFCVLCTYCGRDCMSLESEKGGKGRKSLRTDNGRTGIWGSLRGPRGPKNADDDESWKLSGSIDWQAGGRHSWPLAGTAPSPPLRIRMYIHPGCTCADIHRCPHAVHIHTQIPTKTARIDRFPRGQSRQESHQIHKIQHIHHIHMNHQIPHMHYDLTQMWE